MIVILIHAVALLANILILFLCLRAVLSWFAVMNPYSRVGSVYRWLVNFTEPLVKPSRALIAKLGINTGMFDFSVLLTFFLIEIAERVIIRLLLLI
ncbi:MAG: YggT family protein [Eubacteriales bacterium]|nr:YggT family protein [Eubacteriales bacterium]